MRGFSWLNPHILREVEASHGEEHIEPFILRPSEEVCHDVRMWESFELFQTFQLTAECLVLFILLLPLLEFFQCEELSFVLQQSTLGKSKNGCAEAMRKTYL